MTNVNRRGARREARARTAVVVSQSVDHVPRGSKAELKLELDGAAEHTGSRPSGTIRTDP